MEKSNTLVAIFVLLFFVFTILQQLYIYSQASSIVENYQEQTIAGKASQAHLSLCIDRTTPFFNISACPNSTNQGQRYICGLNGTDPDGDTLVFSDQNISGNDLFNISSTGLIDFTPNQSFVGNHSMNITIDDNTGCENALFSQTLNISVININDPPRFIMTIPDQTLQYGETLYALYLEDHFWDPDDDILSFATIGGISGINISINNNPGSSAYSQVVIKASACVEIDVFFHAEEVYTAEQYYNRSNIVHIKVDCTNQGQGQQQQQDQGAGGGGGSTRECEPDWNCQKWGPCLSNGTQMRRCVDYNGCDPDHYITYQYRACEYPQPPACKEDWQCEAWGPCLPNGTQYRECTDSNKCGTFLEKPEQWQNCTIQQPQNLSGGPSIPAIEDNFPLITYILIVLLLLAAILLIIYKIYKRQIKEIVARIGWYITKKRRKSILIGDQDKEMLLKRLLEIEKTIGKVPLENSAVMVAETARRYFSKVLGLEFEFSPEKFALAMQKKSMDKIIKKILESFFSLSSAVEFSKHHVMPYELLVFLDEFRLIILQTSNSNKKDVEHLPKTRKTVSQQKIDQIFTLVSNSLIPVQFNESTIGKNNYLKALKAFESLKLSEQEIVYPYLSRLFEEINYVSHLVATTKLT